MSVSSGALDWDADTYDRISDLQFSWGVEVLERLPLRGDERVLDAGCGSGRVTALLAERLPRGHVIAVDASPAMIEKARAALAGSAEVFRCDLLELALDEPVDAVFSNAVFHWIHDHDRLFGRLHRALGPGGRLVAQCGGEGNVASLREALDAVAAEEPFAGFVLGSEEPWRFRSPAETIGRLEAAGFVEVVCWLEEKPATIEEPGTFLLATSPDSRLRRLPEELRRPFVDRALEQLGDPLVLDYVRLNISARRDR